MAWLPQGCISHIDATGGSISGRSLLPTGSIARLTSRLLSFFPFSFSFLFFLSFFLFLVFLFFFSFFFSLFIWYSYRTTILTFNDTIQSFTTTTTTTTASLNVGDDLDLATTAERTRQASWLWERFVLEGRRVPLKVGCLSPYDNIYPPQSPSRCLVTHPLNLLSLKVGCLSPYDNI